MKTNTPLDPNAIPIDDYYDEITPVTSSGKTIPNDERLLALNNERLKWMAISLICITILCLLLIGTLIWYFTYYRSKRPNKGGFQTIQGHSSNV